jgi:hypothetical protein
MLTAGDTFNDAFNASLALFRQAFPLRPFPPQVGRGQPSLIAVIGLQLFDQFACSIRLIRTARATRA